MKKSALACGYFFLVCALAFIPTAHSAPRQSNRNDLYLQDGTPLPYALMEVEDTCSDEERQARETYLKAKRKFSRNLSSLDSNEDDVIDAIQAAQKKLNKELRRIAQECKERRLRLTNSARPRSAWVPDEPKRKPIPRAPAVKAKPPKKVVVKEPKPPKPPAEKWALLKNFRMKGRFEQQTAERISKPQELTKNRSLLILEQTTRWNDELRFKFSERGFYDTVVAHQNDENKDTPGTTENDLESELELRDAYLDYSSGNMDIRLGKQQIVWGEAVSIFVADVVNGKDLREFILPDFDQIRLPQWSALLSHTQGDLHVEGVLSIPRFNKLPVEGSEFAYPSPIPAGTPAISSAPVRPETKLSNSDIGFRFSYLFGGLDTSFLFLHTWDKNPVPFQTFQGSTLTITPEYKRQDVLGVTFSKDIFDSIVKGEFVVKNNSYFATDDLTDPDGVVKLTNYEYVLGIDQTWFSKWDTNLQIDQRFLTGEHASQLAYDEQTRTLLSGWIKGRLFNDKVEPEYLIVSNAKIQDRMHRPKITFRCTDWMLFRLGADIFEGKSSRGLFGPFDDRDRGYGELEFRF